MSEWKLQANLDGNQTVVPLKARCTLTCIALAARLIEIKTVNDKRFSEGEITLFRPNGKAFYCIPSLKSNKEPYWDIETKKEAALTKTL